MDVISDPLVDEVTIMTGTQVGKSEILLNTFGYFCDYDPCPIMLMQSTDDLAKDFSTTRIAPMIRDCKALSNKFPTASRDSGNTIHLKKFAGGFVSIGGANSTSFLRSKPIRVLLLDEVDDYPYNVGGQGDPVDLASKRTTNFWNRKIVRVSSPTIKDLSRIESGFKRGDQRFFNIECPHCGELHVLNFGIVKFPKGKPELAQFGCPHCLKQYNNAVKNRQLRTGQWIATNPDGDHPSFHLASFYSPWPGSSVENIAKEFHQARFTPEKLVVVVNTRFAETWDDAGETLEPHSLIDRCEKYKSEVPRRALIVVGGADVQRDRIEITLDAYGAGEECWHIKHIVIDGDPDIAEGNEDSPWDELTEIKRTPLKHESGIDIYVDTIFIDTGGANTQSVYNYVRSHSGEKIFGIKGQGGDGIPIVGTQKKQKTGNPNQRKINIVPLGVDQAKDLIYKRLAIETEGGGYCHFPEGKDIEYFRQLTSEKKITKYQKGVPKRQWVLPSGRRNEALDCRVYAYGALIYRRRRYDKLAFKIKEASAKKECESSDLESAVAKKSNISHNARRIKKRVKNNYVNAWRNC